MYISLCYEAVQNQFSPSFAALKKLHPRAQRTRLYTFHPHLIGELLDHLAMNHHWVNCLVSILIISGEYVTHLHLSVYIQFKTNLDI